MSAERQTVTDLVMSSALYSRRLSTSIWIELFDKFEQETKLYIRSEATTNRTTALDLLDHQGRMGELLAVAQRVLKQRPEGNNPTRGQVGKTAGTTERRRASTDGIRESGV